ncbi:hypothetical protein [Candidatus Magnetominusculus dajiuhuensis]|uniref:hypothetical protein n=1 Tax=Candidatus Magnetominusculus dajiuhuensis TaxID=3137712 RepID=UPI003B4301D8
MNTPSSNFELLDFYRNEIKHEFNLLGLRMGWYLLGQSFLISAFAVCLDPKYSTPPTSETWFLYVIAALGFVTSAMIIPSLEGAHVTANRYINKKRRLLSQHHDELKERKIERDDFFDDYFIRDDVIHEYSLLFSRAIPCVFLILWPEIGIYKCCKFSTCKWTLMIVVGFGLFAAFMVFLYKWSAIVIKNKEAL